MYTRNKSASAGPCERFTRNLISLIYNLGIQPTAHRTRILYSRNGGVHGVHLYSGHAEVDAIAVPIKIITAKVFM